MPEDPPPRQSDRLGVLDEVEVSYLHDGRPDQACRLRHLREPDDEHDQPFCRAHHGHAHEREHDRREGEEEVHRTHQRLVGEAEAVPGDERDDRAADDVQASREHGEHEQVLPPGEEAAEDVPAEVVGREPRVRRRGREGEVDVVGRVVRRDVRADHRIGRSASRRRPGAPLLPPPHRIVRRARSRAACAFGSRSASRRRAAEA